MSLIASAEYTPYAIRLIIYRFFKKLKKKEKLKSYADVKVSILVEREGRNMVCELQLLLRTMLTAKKRDHRIYEITRTKEYRKNVRKLCTLYATVEEEVLAIAMREDVKEMELFMMNHPSFDYLAAHGEKGSSLIHFIARMGNAKMMDFLFSFIPSSKMEKLVNLQRNEEPKTPITIASRHGKLEVVKVS